MSELRPKIKRSFSVPQLQLNYRMGVQNMTAEIRRMKIQNSDRQNFSLIHSNNLYLLFLLGFLTCFGGDLVMQWARKGKVSENTKLFIFIFIVNILLWIDFNVKFSKKREPRGRQECFCETFLADSTNLLFCIIVAPVILCARWIRSVKIPYQIKYNPFFVQSCLKCISCSCP